MNNYIVLDGYRYRTPSKSWKPSPALPGTARLNLNGQLDVAYGSGTMYKWDGTIEASVTPDIPGYGELPWGSPDDLKTSLEKRQKLTFMDHFYPETPIYNVAIFKYEEESIAHMWDAPSNAMLYKVELYGEVA